MTLKGSTTETHNLNIAQAAETTQTEFINTLPWFCYDGFCPAIADNKVPHLDQWHVTKNYATYLTGALTEELARTLK